MTSDNVNAEQIRNRHEFMTKYTTMKIKRSVFPRSFSIRIAGLGLVLLCSSCLRSSGPVQVQGPPPKASAWEKVVLEHTRRDTLNHFHHRTADVRATLVTPRLRSAFLSARSRLHGSAADDFAKDLVALGAPPDEGMDATEKFRPNAEEQILIYISLYTHDKRYRDLAAHDTIWEVFLKKGDAKVKPESIDSLGFSPALQALLPHSDRFDENYAVRFPLVDPASGVSLFKYDKEPIRLHIASAMGNTELKWQLNKSKSAHPEAVQPASEDQDHPQDQLLPRKAKRKDGNPQAETSTADPNSDADDSDSE
jgi:hypothetical protein